MFSFIFITLILHSFNFVAWNVQCDSLSSTLDQSSLVPNSILNPDLRKMCCMSTDQLIVHYGYIVEKYVVETEDKYRLTIFRCYAPKYASSTNRYPVMIQHAMLDSSDTYCLNPPNQALAYILADLGYDVWLLNSRGNKYARSHARYDPNISPGPFWNFSWFECGMYDLPASIDFIREKTGRQKLAYIGHSQGGTIMLVLLSMKPEYNDRISIACLMAPLGYMESLGVPLQSLFITLALMLPFRNREFVRNSLPQKILAQAVCGTNADVCNYGMNFLDGPSKNQRNDTMVPVYFCHFPAGCGINQLIHYGLEVLRGYFGKMMQSLLDSTPDDFPFENISTLVTIHWSIFDTHNPEDDIKKLISRLKNVRSHRIEVEFNHVDYMWGTHANETVYSHIIECISEQIN